ncbi:MAG: hypothetical protein V3T45_06300 [Nitrospinaceae bacterium]|jgi:hypothetical protein
MSLFQDGKARMVMCLRICFTGLLFLVVLIPSLALADACQNAGQNLRASFEVTQGRGGIWGYMEKISSLKGDSMIGFQVDGKLSRIVVIFETQCARTKKPSKKIYQKIENILGDARMIFNLKPGRNPIKEIKAKISGLNANLDKLIKELEA